MCKLDRRDQLLGSAFVSTITKLMKAHYEWAMAEPQFARGWHVFAEPRFAHGWHVFAGSSC